MLSALSFTCITIPDVFSLNTFVLPACQLAPLSKLYASSAKPDSLSSAFTVNVTLWFVHSLGFPVTSVILGFTVSVTSLCTTLL